MWAEKRFQFSNKTMEKCLEPNNIEIHSIENEAEFVILERLIGSLKKLIYQTMITIGKNVYFDRAFVNLIHDKRETKICKNS